MVLLLEVGDPWGQFNTFSDPHKRQAWAAKKDVKIINISMQDVYIRANYQDFQRYQPADLRSTAMRRPACRCSSKK